MADFDYENFVNQSVKKGVILDQTGDEATVYDQLFKSKTDLRSSLRNKLDGIEKRCGALKKEYALYDGFYKGLARKKIAMNEQYAILGEELSDCRKQRQEINNKHSASMADLDKKYFDYTKDECDSVHLKSKIGELKKERDDLREHFEESRAELTKILDAMEKYDVSIPDVEAMRLVENGVSLKYNREGVVAKEQSLAKLKQFIGDCEEKLNS